MLLFSPYMGEPAVLGSHFLELTPFCSHLTAIEEQKHDVKLREASRAGLLVGVLMFLLAGMTALAVVSLWPLFEALPVSSPEVSEQE